MGVRWDGPLLRGGSEEEHERFWRVLLVALAVLTLVLLAETYADDGCPDGEICQVEEGRGE